MTAGGATRHVEREGHACAAALIEVLPSLVRLLMEALHQGGCDERTTPTQYRALASLSERDQLSGELARSLGVTRSSVTATVDVLVERGLVARIETPHDRRQVLLRATPAGRVWAAETRAILVDRLAGVVARVGAGEREQLLSGVAALQRALCGGEDGARAHPDAARHGRSCWGAREPEMMAPNMMQATAARRTGRLEARA